MTRTGLRYPITAALIVLTLGATACGGSDSSATPVTKIGITAADGSAAHLADFSGSPLVVNLWATWCTPCVKEMPAFQTVADGLGNRVAIIGINVGDDAAAAATFAGGLGVSYPQYTDPDGALSTALGVTGLPATAFVAPDGTVLDVHQGAYTADTLRQAIDQHYPQGG